MLRYVRFVGVICRVFLFEGVSASDSGARGVFGGFTGLDCRGVQHCNRPTVGGTRSLKPRSPADYQIDKIVQGQSVPIYGSTGLRDVGSPLIGLVGCGLRRYVGRLPDVSVNLL